MAMQWQETRTGKISTSIGDLEIRTRVFLINTGLWSTTSFLLLSTWTSGDHTELYEQSQAVYPSNPRIHEHRREAAREFARRALAMAG